MSDMQGFIGSTIEDAVRHLRPEEARTRSSAVIGNSIIPNSIAMGYRVVVMLTEEGAKTLDLSSPRLDLIHGNNRGYGFDLEGNSIWMDVSIKGVAGVRTIERTWITDILVTDGKTTFSVLDWMVTIYTSMVKTAVDSLLKPTGITSITPIEEPPAELEPNSNIVRVDFRNKSKPV